MQYEEFRGELDKPTGFEEFNGKLDEPSASSAAAPVESKGPGIIERVTEALPLPVRAVVRGLQGMVASDTAKSIAGPAVSATTSIPQGAEKAARSAVRRAANPETLSDINPMMFSPTESSEDIYGKETEREKAQRALAAERVVASVPSIPGAKSLAEYGEKVKKQIEDSRSPEAKKAIKESQITGNIFKGEIDFGTNPTAQGLWYQAVGVLGSMAPMVLTTIVTRSPTAGAAAGGSSAAGEGARSAEEAIKAMTDEQLAQASPFFRQMVEGGASSQEARDLTMRKASESAAILQGIVATFGDKFTAKLMTDGLGKQALKVAGKTTAGRVGVGTALSATEQGVQEVGEGVAADLGLASVLPDTEIGKDSAGNLVLGALGGLGPGFVGGARRPEEEPAPAPTAEQMMRERGFLVPSAPGEAAPAAPAAPRAVDEYDAYQRRGREELSQLEAKAAAGGEGSLSQEERSRLNVLRVSVGPQRATNFTPADSPSAQAGLVPIVVPGLDDIQINPETERAFGLDQLRTGATNVGTTGAAERAAGVGGAAAGDQLGGGVGAPGLGVPAAGGRVSGVAGGAVSNDGQANAAGDSAGQRAANLIQRYNIADVQPAEQWFGRKGDGYATQADASQALPGRKRMFPGLEWRVEQMPSGKFRIAGYSQEITSGTQAPQAQQAEAQGTQAAGAGAVTAQAGAIAAAPAADVQGAEPARVKPALPVGQIAFNSFKAAVNKDGFDIEQVGPAEFTGQHKIASAVARLLGKKYSVARVTKGDPAQFSNGMINRLGGDQIVVSEGTDEAPLFVAIHEAYHGLPEADRKVLNGELLKLFRQENKGKFLQQFNYTEAEFDEEAPAFMAQVISKRADFWEELRTKVGNKEFASIAKLILNKLGEIVGAARQEYGQEFVDKYISDVEKARSLLSDAYAKAMQEQGLKPDADVGAPVSSNRSRVGMDFKDVIKRTPELQAAAEKVKSGEMTAEQYDRLVNEFKPVEPYTSVPAPASEAEIRKALTSDKTERIGVASRTLKAGDPVGLRLDIPAYANHGTWVVSVHEQEAGYNAGKSIGYEPVAAATNATFGVVEKAAINIAGGKPKATIAVIKGGWKPTTAKQAQAAAQAALKSKAWAQVGMDPERHSYFYDRSTMQPIVAADEVIQIGPLVLAKNPTYGKKSDFMFSRRSQQAKREGVAMIDGRPYDAKRDNFKAPPTDSFLPDDLIERARGYIERFSKEAAPVQISGADRIKAEGMLRPMLERAAQVKPEFDQKIIDIAEEVGALGQMLANLKGMKRAAEKLVIDEGFETGNMRDLLRSTIVVSNYEDAQAVVDAIRREFKILPGRIKNRTTSEINAPEVDARTNKPLDSGYSDVLINVMIDGVQAEIQINTPEMLAAKGAEGHKLYEIEREQPKGSEIRRAVELAQSEFYSAAASAAAARQADSESRMGSDIGGQRLAALSSPLNSRKTSPEGSSTASRPLSSSKNSVPAGNSAGTLISLPPDAASISQQLSLSEDDKGRLLVQGDVARIRQLTAKVASGTVVDGGMRFKPADAKAVRKAIKNAPKADPAIAREIARTLGLSPQELASTSLEYQTGEAKDRAFFAPIKGGIPEVVKFLEDRRRASGLDLLDISDPADQDTLAKLIAAETLAAIRSSGNALEWYDETIAKTLAMAAVKYPELANDANAQMVFRLAMAITSQGLNVENNLGFTMRQYDAFRKQGRFPEVGEGESGEAMVSNFKLINALLDEMGPDMLRRFLVTEFTIGELNQAGFEPGGELVDEKVLGSSVLGPKIGFGFYSNLNGNFEPVTMDMWFMRTIGRLTGSLRSFDAAKFAGQVKRLRDSLDERGDDAIYADRFDPELVERARTDNDAAIELARQVKKAHEKDFRENRAAFDAGERKKSQLVFAADTIIQSIDKPKDVPASGMERRLLREVVRKAVAQVEQAYGQRIPPAAMQALIWYPEQELYKAMGVKLSVTSQDYAGATEKVLTEEGYDAKRLRAAAKSGSDRVRQANGRDVGRAAQGGGQAAGGTGPLQGTERERFLRDRYERTQLQLERVTPKRRGVIFEVAPDPNNEALSNAWRSLTKEQRLEISGRVARDVVPRVLAQLETDGIVVSQVGSYLDDTNPSFTLLLEKGDPVELAKTLGFVLSQDSMMVVSPKPFKGGEEVGAITIQVGDKTDAEIKQIYDSLREIEVNGERPVGGQSFANGAMTILNYSNVPTPQLAILVDQKLNKGYTVLTRSVFAAFPEKKEYDYASQTNDGRGSRAVLRQRARELRGEATAALERELDAAGIRRSNRAVTPLGFYSALSDGLGQLKASALPPVGWKDAIKGLVNKGQVKADEVQWIGINEWLDLQQGKVTKEQVQEYLNANGVQVEETVLPLQGGINNAENAELESLTRRRGRLSDAESARLEELNKKLRTPSAKYADYGPAGGENYREVLLTLPGRENYRSVHWAQYNVLAHLRVDDRTDADGKRVLFIREIQSDWGQDGKKKGFTSGEEKAALKEARAALKDIEAKRADAKLSMDTIDNLRDKPLYKNNTEAERDRMDGRYKDAEKIYLDLLPEKMRLAALVQDLEFKASNAVPAAPFVGKTDAWVSLALKRAAIMAAQEGYDKVAIINGEQAADMFDMSKQVQSLFYVKNDDGTYLLQGNIATRGGESYEFGDRIKPDELENYVGKDVAEKIQQGVGVSPDNGSVKGKPVGKLSGLDLKVGGEGMKTFYDNIVPKVAKDVVKKLGGQIDSVNIDGDSRRLAVTFHDGAYKIMDLDANIGSEWLDGRYATKEEAEAAKQAARSTDQLGFDITPEMKAKVEQGVPMFSKKAVKLADDAAAQEQFLQRKAEEAGFKTVDEFVDQDYEGFVAAAAQWRQENPADVMYSRRAATKAAYEKRIDDLFAGGKPQRVGAVMLDNSDMLSLLGYRDTPVYLVESKVTQGMDNHPNMTPAVWKKIPEWMDNPAAVFDSDTVDGRLVFVAPETVKGNLVLMVAEPDAQVGRSLNAHLMVNAYDKDGSKPPVTRWTRDGLLRYVDQKKFPAVLSEAGLQLPGTAIKNQQGTRRILTERQLAGYQKLNNGVVSEQQVMRSNKARESIFIGRDELGRPTLGVGAKAYRLVADLANVVLDKVAMKPISTDLGRAMRKMKTEIEQARKLTAGVAAKLSELTPDERELISDVIEKELKRGVKPPKRVLEVAASMRDIMSEQTAELVRLGMMSEDAAGRWDGKYLPRFYESKLMDEGKAWLRAAKSLLGRTKTMQGIRGSSLKGRGLFQTIPVDELPAWVANGWEERDPNFDPAVDTEITVWRDYTRKERENMGEVRDAMFRFVMGYTKSQKDIALGRLYENLANTVASSKEKEGYVQVPRTNVEDTYAKRYGKLAGKWVPKEVLDHLSAFDDSQQGELMKFYSKAMSMWKEGKTVLNPVSHANNVLSNVTMAHFAGVSYWDVNKYYAATRDLVKRSPMVQEAEKAGLFQGTMTQAELVNMLPDQLKVLAAKTESKAGKAVDNVWNAMSFWLRKPFGKAYEAEDLYFRYLIYRDAREQGLEPDAAVDYAQKYIFTYDDLPKGARAVRNFALPFFAYTYKVVPAMAETALKYPWRYAAPAAALYAVNAAMYAIAAGAEDDDWMELIKRYVTDPEFRAQAKAMEADERVNLPSWMKGASLSLGTPKTIRLGVDEATGLPVFLDVSRIFPGGDLFDAHNNAGGIPLLAPITPNNPVLTVAAAMLYNKDTFRGTEVVKESDTDAEAAAKRAKWMYQQIAPAIAVGNSHFDRAMNVIANVMGEPLNLGVTEYTGLDNQGLPVQAKYAIPQTVGIKARPVDLEAGADMRAGEQKRLIQEVSSEIRRNDRLENRGAITPEQADKVREKLTEKRQRLREGLTVEGEERE